MEAETMSTVKLQTILLAPDDARALAQALAECREGTFFDMMNKEGKAIVLLPGDGCNGVVIWGEEGAKDALNTFWMRSFCTDIWRALDRCKGKT